MTNGPGGWRWVAARRCCWAAAIGRPGAAGGGSNHIRPQAGTFRFGNAAEPATLDPSMVDATWEDVIVGDLMMGLITEDTLARPIPGMAERWETSPDGLTWIFYLRDTTWSDGTGLTADDFVYAWRRTLAPATASPYAYYLYIVKNAEAVNAGKLPGTELGIRALDARRLEVRLEHPAPYLVEMLSHTSMMPLPRHAIEAKGKSWTQPGNYVCNGAFRITEWIPNEHITAVKNPRFYDAGNVKLERVVYYPTDDYGAALRRLRAGELDVQDRLPNEQIGWIRKNMPELLNPGAAADHRHDLGQSWQKTVRRYPGADRAQSGDQPRSHHRQDHTRGQCPGL